MDECRVLTDLLDGSRALSKHTEGSVDYFPVEPPGSTVVSKGDVFPIFGQNVCGYLHTTRETERDKTWMIAAAAKKWRMRRGLTHISGPPCKDLSLLHEHFFGVSVVVDDDDAVGAPHQRVRRPVLLLQILEKHMGRERATQAQQTADHRQRRETWDLLRATRR